MTTESRMEEILLRQGWATESELAEAMACRREGGGRLEDHLLRLGYVGRRYLLDALAIRYACPSVDLAEVTIAPEALALVPAEAARLHLAIPFAFDPQRQLVKVACANPLEENLLSALHGLLPGKEVMIFVTLESSLESALLQFHRPTAIDRAELPSDSASANSNADIPSLSEPVLIVTHDLNSIRLFAQALSAERGPVVIIDSIDEAEAAIESGKHSALFIHDLRPGPYFRLLRAFRRRNPGRPIRFGPTAGAFLFGGTGGGATASAPPFDVLLLAGLCERSECDEDTGLPRLLDYTARICDRLGFPEPDRLSAIRVAWIVFCAFNARDLTYQSDHLAAALKPIMEVHRKFDIDSPIAEILLALVSGDLRVIGPDPGFARLAAAAIHAVLSAGPIWSATQPLPLEQYESLRERLKTQNCDDFRLQINEVFLEIVGEDVSPQFGKSTGHKVAVLNEGGDDSLMLKPCLENLGFNVAMSASLETFLQSFRRRHPDLVLLVAGGPADRAQAYVRRLASHGFHFDQTPTFVLVPGVDVPSLLGLLRLGIEDILAFDSDLDPLLVKVCRIRSRLEQAARQRLLALQDVGTHGTLEDMNVVDLLQAMGYNDKTLRLCVTAHGHHLTVYLDRGNLIFAECGDKTGADAVSQSLNWTRGVWSVDPVSRDDLPEANNDRAIDSILIEGCYALDEQSRPERPVDDSDGRTFSDFPA